MTIQSRGTLKVCVAISWRAREPRSAILKSDAFRRHGATPLLRSTTELAHAPSFHHVLPPQTHCPRREPLPSTPSARQLPLRPLVAQSFEVVQRPPTLLKWSQSDRSEGLVCSMVGEQSASSLSHRSVLEEEEEVADDFSSCGQASASVPLEMDSLWRWKGQLGFGSSGVTPSATHLFPFHFRRPREQGDECRIA